MALAPVRRTDSSKNAREFSQFQSISNKVGNERESGEESPTTETTEERSSAVAKGCFQRVCNLLNVRRKQPQNPCLGARYKPLANQEDRELDQIKDRSNLAATVSRCGHHTSFIPETSTSSREVQLRWESPMLTARESEGPDDIVWSHDLLNGQYDIYVKKTEQGLRFCVDKKSCTPPCCQHRLLSPLTML